MSIETPVVIPPAPEPPNRADRTTFNAKAVAWADYQKDELVPGVNAAADNVNHNANEALISAGLAQGSALQAQDARDVALASANFKGLWEDLSGALNKPASVKHNGRFWLLLNNLPNVALSEPEEGNDDWTSTAAGTVSQEISASGPMLAGVRYIVMTADIILEVPAPVDTSTGDLFAAVDASGGGFFMDWNGHTVKKDTQTVNMRVPKYKGFSVEYSGSTLA